MDLKVEKIMSTSPKTIYENEKLSEALELMENNAITVLPVVDKEGKVKGIIHLHDLLGGKNA